MTALDVTGLTVSFGTTTVLSGVDLRVTDGLTAVLGASGCGKTTLLRTVAGFVDPDAGSIVLGGRPVHGQGRSTSPHRRNVGYVPQEGALFPHLSVARNVAFGLTRRQRRRPEGRVREVLELVEFPLELSRRYPHELSGGQQQRVALARALAPGPSLVLLDEPFSSLDAGLRVETGRAVVRALRASNAAGLLVTHDQSEALSLADRVAVMAQGHLRQVDTPLNIYLSPADEQVATFLGHAALLPGESCPGQPGRPVVRCALGVVPVHGHTGPGAVTLAIRPEQLRILAAEATDETDLAPDETTSVAAYVVDVSFYGHDATTRLRVDGSDQTLTVRTPVAAVPGAGDKVRLTLAGTALCFPRQVAG